MNKGKDIKPIIFIIILLGIMFVFLYELNKPSIESINFTEFVNIIENKEIDRIDVFQNEKILIIEKTGIAYEYSSKGTTTHVYETYLEPFVLLNPDVKMSQQYTSNSSGMWVNYAIIGVLLLLIAYFFIWSSKNSKNSDGSHRGAGGFGKSRVKLNKNEGKVIKFDDVAGLDEEKEDLIEIVSFLKNPDRYKSIGAKIPKGVLMVGPPGTGKTYLSKAVAGEAGVPFFFISGSDFVELYVGVGASRVRDTFKQAKQNAPCIIFIDEIDAVGRKRGAGLGSGNDEREQTLNALLVEMDGFSSRDSDIIIMAATNRADVLDPALLRPGRFDRKVHVGLPDIRGREEILRIHGKNKKLAPDFSYSDLAKKTIGFTPAELENLLNEAALMSARENKKKIDSKMATQAFNKVIAGTEKKSRVRTEKVNNLVAYHEAGHAVIHTVEKDVLDPVHLVTIVPRSSGAGGFTLPIPQEDLTMGSKKKMQAEMVALLGGRVAEQIILGDISTGASNDIERVTTIARDMVKKYGMSDIIGPINYGSDEEIFVGGSYGKTKVFSDETATEIDNEVKRIIDEAYNRAKKILNENLTKLHDIAKALLKVETLYRDDYEFAFEHGYDAFLEKYEQNKIQEEINKAKDDQKKQDDIEKAKSINNFVNEISDANSEDSNDEDSDNDNDQKDENKDTSKEKENKSNSLDNLINPDK